MLQTIYLKRGLSLVSILLFFTFEVGCSNHNKSIFANLPDNQDGSIASEIPNDDNPDFPNETDNTPTLPDELSAVEQKLTKELHANQVDKVSFLVVDAEKNQVIRSHLATTPRRLASLTKISTALAALQNVNGVSYDKIGSMLKSSNNGEASRYVRLAAKSIENIITTGGEYTAASSCPNSTSAEIPAAHSVLTWLKKQRPEANWDDAEIRDGAGCDYGNKYTALQMIHVLEYASSLGKIFAGKSFEDLLSIAGVEGTWRNYNTDSKGMIFAKTGTLSPNSNLAGYFYVNQKGQLHKYYFTVFVEKRINIDTSTQARKYIEALVRNWVHQLSL